MAVIPPTAGEIVLTFLYGADSVVDMYDNHVLGWYFNDTSSTDDPSAPWPCIVSPLQPPGTMTYKPPGSGGGEGGSGGMDILSPVWVAIFREKAVAAHGVWTGSPVSVFDFIATNNGAQRKLRGNFVFPLVVTAWAQWKSRNPGMFVED